ncbi:MAG TPA: hypothetical protein VFS42_09525, partial [Burkholderiaceae bacterium]|nr:hypothetical protein [Burkholderiaceae bacterium]
MIVRHFPYPPQARVDARFIQPEPNTWLTDSLVREFVPRRALETEMRAERIRAVLRDVPAEQRQDYIDAIERCAARHGQSTAQRFLSFLRHARQDASLWQHIEAEVNASRFQTPKVVQSPALPPFVAAPALHARVRELLAMNGTGPLRLPTGYRLGSLPTYDRTISGHGAYWPKASPLVPRTFVVPRQTSVIELCPPGAQLSEDLATLIDNRLVP